jgi:hypothetical protein
LLSGAPGARAWGAAPAADAPRRPGSDPLSPAADAPRRPGSDPPSPAANAPRRPGSDPLSPAAERCAPPLCACLMARIAGIWPVAAGALVTLAVLPQHDGFGGGRGPSIPDRRDRRGARGDAPAWPFIGAVHVRGAGYVWHSKVGPAFVEEAGAPAPAPCLVPPDDPRSGRTGEWGGDAKMAVSRPGALFRFPSSLASQLYTHTGLRRAIECGWVGDLGPLRHNDSSGAF